MRATTSLVCLFPVPLVLHVILTCVLPSVSHRIAPLCSSPCSLSPPALSRPALSLSLSLSLPGLKQYAAAFHEASIDGTVLVKHVTEDHLADLLGVRAIEAAYLSTPLSNSPEWPQLTRIPPRPTIDAPCHLCR